MRLLIPIILEKLPANVRKQISRDKGDEAWTLTSLRESIQREIEADRAGETTIDFELDLTDQPPATAAFLTTTRQKASKPQHCAFCKKTGHKSTDCMVVTDKTKRLEIVKQDKLCFNCLSGAHRVSDCKSKFKCHVCKRKHHTAICTGEKHPAATRDDVRTLVSSDFSRNSSVLLKTAIADIKARGSTMSESATLLFDDGSQRSFITERTDRAIGIDFNNCDSELINVSTLGAKSTGLRSMKIAEITVIIPNGCNVNIRALIVPQITTPLRNHLKSSASIARLPYLRELELAHPVSDVYDFEVSILVGADFYYSFVGDHVIRGQGPTAVSSKLGYLLSGPLSHPNSSSLPTSTVMHVATHTSGENSLLQNFWNVESIGITDDHVSQQEVTYDSYTKNKLRSENNRYVAKLPWRQDHPALPTNRNVCEKRTRTMVQRLTPEIRQVYKSNHKSVGTQFHRDSY
ncbi:uncharacterized protein [Ptychodera flava]|uniref:uncharacterized protein n=1 Tax=Ptychodera flava TaxID=63121 RepID=UPI00396A6B76